MLKFFTIKSVIFLSFWQGKSNFYQRLLKVYLDDRVLRFKDLLALTKLSTMNAAILNLAEPHISCWPHISDVIKSQSSFSIRGRSV